MEELSDICHRLGVEYVYSLPSPDDAAELVKQLPIAYARKFGVVPLRVEDGKLLLLTADPLKLHEAEDVGRIYGLPVRLAAASPVMVTEFINQAYEISAGDASEMLKGVEEPSLEEIAEELESSVDLLDSDEEAPIVKLINSLLQQAVKEKASDVHIEVYADEIAVRMRVDGILYTVVSPPKRIHPQVVSRVKIMAGMDIAEKRLPQDGRISVKTGGREVDVRVSTIPTSFGERVVMRLLDKSRNLLYLEQLGMGEAHLAEARRLMGLSNGILLVTGPTGSGKTTTLYSILGELDKERRNIITVEDPVEYQIRGISQMQVNPAINLSFADGLRAILRQDPDVIMVGEIRDEETAAMAVQASLTGHLVFSTLHTNDSASAITRLLDIGVEPFLIASSLEGVLAQRLVRVLCEHCKKPVSLNAGHLKAVGLRGMDKFLGKEIYEAEGCARCMNSGYRGRSGIYELLVITDAIRSSIIQGHDSNSIMAAGVSAGMKTLRSDGFAKLLDGTTSLDELMRVTDDHPTAGEL